MLTCGPCRPMKAQRMTAFLPQDDPHPSNRAKQLQKAQEHYRYNYDYVSPLALLDRVPIHDEFSFSWLETVGKRVIVGLENMVGVEIDEHHIGLHRSKLSVFQKMLSIGAAEVKGLKHLVSDALRFNGRIGAEARRPEKLEDYARLFHTIGLPPIAKDYMDDRVFAWMRLGGPNSVMLTKVNDFSDKFPVTDDHLQQVCSSDTLEAALAEGRLYQVDFYMLDGVEEGDFPHGQKYIYAPIAMFVVDRESKQLLPFAIQIKQKPADDNPIFTPADGWNWMIAKTMVEVSDGNVHEASTHLGRTHLFMEPFVITTFRQLAPGHPVARLLGPHFEGTLAINEAAWKHLIANKGAVDKLFGASINASRGLAAASVTGTPFNDAMLPDTFAARGVADSDLLPDYPYRDDSLLYWNAIEQWVSDYLKVYYPNESDPRSDVELQAWYTELVAKDGGRVAGFGESAGIESRSYLAQALTLIIYTCSVQHAAVNFPQYDLMSYVPNMPLASYTPAPVKKSGGTEQDYLDMLPPMDMAELQMDLGFLLGTVHYTQLGQYRKDQFTDQRLSDPLAGFQQRITDIGSTIQQRNSARRPYEFLVPSGVPQSINI